MTRQTTEPDRLTDRLLAACLGLGFVAGLAVGLWLCRHRAPTAAESAATVRRDTLWLRDPAPEPVAERPAVRTVAVAAKKRAADAPKATDGSAPATPATDTHSEGDDPTPASIRAEVPAAEAESDTLILAATQRTYSGDGYTAFVSGIDPRLDSIRLAQPTVTLTQRQPAPRLAVGLTAGAGYGVFGHRPDIFVGLAVTYNLTPRSR